LIGFTERGGATVSMMTLRWVFDGWRGNEGRSDTRPLLTALQEVFQDFYDHDDAKHLCNLYEIIFNA
jgi:hypothetical protein